MYKKIKPSKTSISVNACYEGETIEQKINRIVNNKEPIKDGAPIIFTERKDGVLPEYDIRTDRWEIAVEKMDYVSRSQKAKRDESIAKRNAEKEKASETKNIVTTETKPKPDGGTEPLPPGPKTEAK